MLRSDTFLCMVLDFYRIFDCKKTKKIWDYLINFHEVTSLVKRFRIDMLSTDYEMFKMKSGELLQHKFTRLTSTVNKNISKEETNH